MTARLPPHVHRVLKRAAETKQALERRLSDRWLQIEYRRCLYGGWRREDGSEAPPHHRAIQFHEAGKATFCPTCNGHLGYAEKRSDTFTCRTCNLELIVPPLDQEGGDWLLSGPSFSKHFPLTLNPYFEQAMSNYIVDTVKNQQKVVTQYVLDVDGRTERVHCLSYEQYLKAGRDQTNPFEGPRWKGALFDEPPPRDVWIATKRGLMKWMSRYSKPPFVQFYTTLFIGGGNQSSKSFSSRAEWTAGIKGERPWDESVAVPYGRTIIAATPLDCPWLFHEIYSNAWNKGGSNRSIFAIEFSIYDNPALTERAIKNFEEGMTDEEREARIHGRFKHLSGRVFSEFDPAVHTYDPNVFDPLRRNYSPAADEPSNVPLILAIDPHYRRPWSMCWMAVMPDDTYYIVKEWPSTPDLQQGNANMGFDDYAEVIRDIEAGFPGGEKRVRWRDFDPNLARTPQLQALGRTMQDEMRQRGLYFRTDVNDKLHQGHSAIHTLLQWDRGKELDTFNRPRLYVSAACRNIIAAFANYTWDEFGDRGEKAPKDKPKDLGKDRIDVVRYCVMRKPRFIDWTAADDYYRVQQFKRLRRRA